MGGKQNKCCCCDCMEGATACCSCACRRLCVTFTPDDYASCFAESDELIWDSIELAYIGTVSGIDLRYYFERVGDQCFLKLRSDALSFPEGYEAEWVVKNSDPYALHCRSLETQISVSDNVCPGTLETRCATKEHPSICTGCDCVCECLCITYQNGDCFATYKACWDDYIQGWQATLDCGDYHVIDVVITIEPTSSYDSTCILKLSIGNDILVASLSCPEIGTTFTITEYGQDDTTITVRCAKCEEDCSNTNGIIVPCCVNALPRTTHATLGPGVDGNGPGCLCVTPTTYELTYGPVTINGVDYVGWYKLGIPFCGYSTLDLLFECRTDGSSCVDFVLFGKFWDSLGGCQSTNIVDFEVTNSVNCDCDPLHLIFRAFTFCCGPGVGGGPQPFSIEITL